MQTRKAKSQAPLNRAPEQEAGDGLLDVSEPVDGRGDAVSDALVDVGAVCQVAERVLLVWG